MQLSPDLHKLLIRQTTNAPLRGPLLKLISMLISFWLLKLGGRQDGFRTGQYPFLNYSYMIRLLPIELLFTVDIYNYVHAN